MGKHPDPKIEQAKKYTASLRRVQQLRLAALFAVPVVFILLGQYASPLVFGVSRTDNLYFAVGLLWVEIYILTAMLTITLSGAQHRINVRFGLAHGSLGSWAVDSLKAHGIGFAVGFAIVELVFAAMNLPGSYSWLLGAVGVSLLYSGFVYVVPELMPVFYRVREMAEGSLSQRIRLLAERADVKLKNVYVWHISGRTRRANAMVVGFGNRRKIIVTDTFIDNFTEEEIEVIVAHEMGHCAHHDVVRRLMWQTVMFAPVMWIISGIIGNELAPGTHGGWTNPAAVPVFWLFWLLMTTYGSAIMTSFCREQERAADRFAWSVVPNVSPFISAMNKLTEMNLTSYDKSEERKYTHPATPERIAAAEEYARQQGQALAQSAATVS